MRGAAVYTHVILWAACDRVSKIAHKLKLTESKKQWSEVAQQIKKTVMERGVYQDHFVAGKAPSVSPSPSPSPFPFSPDFFSAIGGKEVEPRLLLLPEIGFCSSNDSKFLKTVAAIEQRYKKLGSRFIVVDNEWDGLHPYNSHTGLPIPSASVTAAVSVPPLISPASSSSSSSSSTSSPIAVSPAVTTTETGSNPNAVTARFIHSFWYISALARIGRMTEARELFEFMLTCVNSCGLLSDSIDVETGELWGNFPMTNCQSAFLRCASLLSKKWSEEL
jgi:GH15 family glucan-1,4-alpha-glucosidase